MLSEEEFEEEEEEVVTEPISPPKQTRTRQTRSRRVKPIPEKPIPKPSLRRGRSTSRDAPPPRTVTLRSTTLTYSSDEDEAERTSVRSIPKSVSRRTDLSETRFKKRINDIGKKKVVSSTPYSNSSKTTTTTTKVKLDFDRSFPRRSTRNAVHVFTEPPTVVEESTTTVEEDIMEEGESIVQEANTVEEESIVESVVEDHPDGQKVVKRTVVERERETWIGEVDSDQRLVRVYIPRPAFFRIGWRECVLALLITGVGALGYMCHCTDYCSFC